MATTHAYGSEEKVIKLRRQYSAYWRDKDDHYWFAEQTVREHGGRYGHVCREATERKAILNNC